MNWSSRRPNQNNLVDENDGYYERRALIDDDELCDDEVDLLSTGSLGIRQRQPAGRAVRSNLGFNYQGGHEMKNLNNNNNGGRIRDPNGDQILEFTTYEIKPGDSLRNICLRYACSINQVKRLNGIMSDQEFYGLRYIKLPMGKMGLLEDVLKTNASSEDLLKFRDSNANLNALNNADGHQNRMPINSPGCALSVSTTGRNPGFKPLLSPGLSSDRINDLNKFNNPYTTQDHQNRQDNRDGWKHQHSHSFSSLRDFANDTNIYIGSTTAATSATNQNLPTTPTKPHQSFIKSDILHDDHIEIDDLIITNDMEATINHQNGGGNSNVERVFQDLDFHVERAKAAAETYDQRAAELADRIDINGPAVDPIFRPRVSKIPELFYCSENFGLNLRKLLVIIFVVCLLVPLIYLNQATEGNGSQL